MDLNKEVSPSQSESRQAHDAIANNHLINTFIEITSSTADEAQFFLESHNFELDAAVSTFLESVTPVAAEDPNADEAPPAPRRNNSTSRSFSPSESSRSASLSPSRSRSPSPPSQSRSLYSLRSRRPPSMASSNPNSDNDRDSRRNSTTNRRVGGIHTFSDLNRSAREGSDSDSDRPPEYYTGGEKSGMLVQDRSRDNDVEAIFSQARQMGAVAGPADVPQQPSSSRSFTGTGRLLTGETVTSAPQQQAPGVTTHTITFWRNGFTVDNGPLRRLDDPENAPFLQSIRNSERPKELEPAVGRTQVEVSLVRKDEDCPEPKKQQAVFQGVGRTLGSSTSPAPAASDPSVGSDAPSSTNILSPAMGLVVDENQPSTSIQLRLADGTRMVSRFNYHHTVRDIRAFIDASRPGKARTYQLQTMGFPPKQLGDLDQTIEQAGLANSVVIQKF